MFKHFRDFVTGPCPILHWYRTPIQTCLSCLSSMIIALINAHALTLGTVMLNRKTYLFLYYLLIWSFTERHESGLLVSIVVKIHWCNSCHLLTPSIIFESQIHKKILFEPSLCLPGGDWIIDESWKLMYPHYCIIIAC